MRNQTNSSTRFWVIGCAALIIALILGANGHLLYVAMSSQPGCAEETVKASTAGAEQVLRAAKDGCR